MSSSPPEQSRRPGGRRAGRTLIWVVVPTMLAAALVLYLLIDFRGRRVLAPAPPPEGDVPTVPELPPSTVAFQLLYDMDDVFRATEDRIPSRWGDLEKRRSHPRNPRVTYAVELDRGPLDMALRGDSVHLATTLHYQGRVWFTSPFGGELTTTCSGGESSDRPRALLRLSSPLNLGEDWQLRPDLRVEELVPVSDTQRDRCRVSLGPLQLDVTDPLLATARSQLQDVLAKLDAEVGQLNLKAAIESRWAQLGSPIRLRDSVWLQLDPNSVVVTGLRHRSPYGRTLSIRVGLVGHPRVVVGARPNSSRGPPPLVSGSVEENFVALLETRIEHATASEMASRALRSRTFEIAGRTLRIEDVEVFGADGGRVTLAIQVDGAVAGRLYLVGTPELDSSTGQITVPDLGFSVQTRNVLVRGAAWLLQGTFPERLRRYARGDIGPSIERARSLASTELDRRVSETLLVRGALGSLRMLRPLRQRAPGTRRRPAPGSRRRSTTKRASLASPSTTPMGIPPSDPRRSGPTRSPCRRRSCFRGPTMTDRPSDS